MKPPAIIAEIGINHDGDVDTALELVDVARVAGADYVKFQKRTPELCVAPHLRDAVRKTPWGEMTYLEYRHRIEFGRVEYDTIDHYCRHAGLPWFASVWDLPSLDFILSYEPPHLKIPSALVTHVDLLRAAGESGVHVYLSTGMSTLEEVDRAVEVLRGASCRFTLMHCNSSYPAQNEELNLRCMETLRERYACPVGYSGHEFGLIPSVVAAALGAECIERHVTLKRTRTGSDHMASVEPIGLMKLVNYVRTIPVVLGDGEKRVHDSELPAREKLRYFVEDRGRRRRDDLHLASAPVP